ncbi:MAG: hypothetical protein AB2669_07240 [Candidatus Thiodiazotropha endolucinida]|nr:hypothetical protein [Candidatus Thiodiazotropha taylori]MCW4250335.1 hypothetical protein [Candidatus Thiodiazotropha endolucinida]MCG8042331.1 hypothetical protein [Candidatus Thiodiazotropha taylori]MCG8100839.1 hypothetical protein [Candidatus Thiodiazotropha taylori]MCG8122191.1 hypothetical protein [Candidatus Thiodiazotropha taylori]
MNTPLTPKQQYWHQHLQQADGFEGTLADYARSQGLKAQTLYQWRSVLRNREMTQVSTQTVFTEVSQPAFTHPSLVVSLGQAQMEFSALPDPRWLSQVISGE